jgi:hypothetical protein
MNLNRLRRAAEARSYYAVLIEMEVREMVEEATRSAGENTLGRLNDMLFDELENLRNADVGNVEALQSEIARAKAIEDMSMVVIDNARTILDATRLRASFSKNAHMPKMLGE